MGSTGNTAHRELGNKSQIVGQKVPFKLKDIWALCVRLQMECRVHELALFNLGIDSRLRGCDLVFGSYIKGARWRRAVVMPHKAQRSAQFESIRAACDALQVRIKQAS